MSSLDGEILAEVAASLGRSGRALESALVDLEAHDEAHRDFRENGDRQRLLQVAADRAWALFVQFELAGLSTQTQLEKRYRIPHDVLMRVGIRKADPKR
ncbi:MAG: DUF6665 family protein [Pseudomonadota bacterium]